MPTVDPVNFSLENILSVGRAVIVDPCDPEEDKSLRFGAFVRGWLVEDYVLVDARTEADKAGMLNRGQTCVLRFMADGTAYAFPTRVIDMGSGAYYTFFRVTWPTEIKKVSVRKYERVELSIPVAVEAGDGTPIRGDMIDLSAGGCRVSIPKTLEKSDTVTISFNLPDGTVLDKLSGGVRNVLQSKDRFLVGLEFQNLTSEQIHNIEFYVASSLSRKRSGESGSPWILIVDTQPERCEPIRNALEKENFKTVVENSPATGIGRLTISLPSVMLVAEEQEKCSGLDICRIIRSTPRFESLRVYLYTEKSPNDVDLTKRAEQAGASGVYFSANVPDAIVKNLKKIIQADEKTR